MNQQNHINPQQINQSNVQLPQPQQNTLTVLSQRSSPGQSQQAKKVIVQSNNAGDMDDLEESITAAVLTKHTLNETAQQFQTPTPALRQTNPLPQFNFTTAHQYQQQVAFDQQQPQQHNFNQLLMDTDSHEDDGHLLTLSNGQQITLAEYKRIHQTPHSNTQQQPSR